MAVVDLEHEYRAHGPALIRFATALVGPDDAADVVSNVVTATLGRGALSEVADVRAYWMRAVVNTAASWHRSNGRRLRRERSAARVGTTTDAAMDPSEARVLLGGLSMQQRAVVYLTYWHDWSPASIAEALGISDGSVRKQLARARAELREVLSDGHG